MCVSGLAPRIVSHPLSSVLSFSSDFLLQCSASPSGVTVSWTFNDEPLDPSRHSRLELRGNDIYFKAQNNNGQLSSSSSSPSLSSSSSSLSSKSPQSNSESFKSGLSASSSQAGTSSSADSSVYGVYRCLASNEYGSAISLPAYISSPGQ